MRRLLAEYIDSKKGKISLILVLFVSIFLLTGSRVNAATISVNENCSLAEAIDSINASNNIGGCQKSGSNFGTDDSIHLPMGTTTLNADLPIITTDSDLKISGSGANSTLIDAQGFTGFVSGDPLTVEFNGFKIKSAAPYAFDLNNSYSKVTFNSVDVDDSTNGVRVKAQELTAISLQVRNCISVNGNATVGMDVVVSADIGDSQPFVNISNSRFENNESRNLGLAGLAITSSGQQAQNLNVTINKTSSLKNKSHASAGIITALGEFEGTLSLAFDATTIAYNEVVESSTSDEAITTSGLFLSVKKLSDQNNFTNITIAYNTLENSVNSGLSVAGIFGMFLNLNRKLSFINSTVVGNQMEITTPGKLGKVASILLIAVNDQNGVSSISSAASMSNGLILENRYNGQIASCANSIEKSKFGAEGIVDATPENNGSNLTDDSKCTGFRVVSDLYSSVEHSVKDNGGPVPTLALKDNSPAVNGGQSVSGITTDARGIARSGYFSAGAFQGVLGASQNAHSSSGVKGSSTTLADTGVVLISIGVLVGIVLLIMFYVYIDFRKHKAPLRAIDPEVRYSFTHHIKIVTLPLFKYRLQFRIQKISNDSQVRKF